MAEDSSSQAVGATPPTGDGQPATPPTPAPAAPPVRAGLDWQLVALGAVLWVVAVGIVLSKWTRVRVDWQLGNIKERLDFSGMIDQDAVDTLVSMGTGDDKVVAMLGDEVFGPQRNLDDPRYRITLIKALERIPGQAALRALTECLRDGDARVRANVYVSLETRAKATPAEAPQAIEVLETMLKVEPEPIARSYVVKSLGQLGKLEAPRPEACWYFIAAFREAEDRDVPATGIAQRDREDLLGMLRRVREECANSLRALSKESPERLPLDAAGSDEARAVQVQAWEEWFVGKGEKLPEGQLRYEEWHAKQEEARRASVAPVSTPAGGGAGGPDSPGSKGGG